jgi:hypothetical protein
MALFKPFSPVLSASRSQTKKSVRDALARACEASARAAGLGVATLGGPTGRQGFSRETCGGASLVPG